MSLSIVILAAGLGKRMLSDKPKVLHSLGGIPLIQHVLRTCLELNPDVLSIVHGRKQKDQIQNECFDPKIQWVEQNEPLGTGHAVLQAFQSLQGIKESKQLLVLYGDVPLVRVETLKQLLKITPTSSIGIVTCRMEDPTGLGRILRNKNGEVIGIVEEKDATPEEKKILEINTGIMCLPCSSLGGWLNNLKTDNKQNEYYLTDIVESAVQQKVAIHSVQPQTSFETRGVNSRRELVELERYFQRQQVEKLLSQGVHLFDFERIDVRGTLEVEKDVTIDINVIFEGHVKIGQGSTIGPFVHIKDCVIGKNVHIRSHSVLEGAVIEDRCIVGPFARIRKGTELALDVRVGNFVELKASHIGVNTKINHLSYIGDAEVKANVNIGAGTVTCNFDGISKHRTIIEESAFIGSGTQLVAPVTVGRGAVLGAGTTLLKNAPDHQLTVTQKTQKTVEGWVRPIKETSLSEF